MESVPQCLLCARGAEPPWAGVDGFMESLFSQKRSSLSQMPTADFLYSSTGQNWVMFQLQAMLGEPSATAKTCAPSVLKAHSHNTATQNRQTGSTGCPGKHGPYLSASWFNKECQVASHLRSDDSSVLLLPQVSLSSTLRDTHWKEREKVPVSWCWLQWQETGKKTKRS